jgi:hypothetical protein
MPRPTRRVLKVGQLEYQWSMNLPRVWDLSAPLTLSAYRTPKPSYPI